MERTGVDALSHESFLNRFAACLGDDSFKVKLASRLCGTGGKAEGKPDHILANKNPRKRTMSACGVGAVDVHHSKRPTPTKGASIVATTESRVTSAPAGARGRGQSRVATSRGEVSSRAADVPKSIQQKCDAFHYRIGCIGDSCTYGTGLQQCDKYPEQLKRFLALTGPSGSAYLVQNFGKSGATAGETLDKSYAETKQCAKALEFAADAYVIMLGTNDAWHGEPEKTEAGLTKLIHRLKTANKLVTVILVLPPGLKGGRMQANLPAIVHPAVRKVAAAYKLELIEPELFNSKEAYLADRVHLSCHGARCVAEACVGPLLQASSDLLRP